MSSGCHQGNFCLFEDASVNRKEEEILSACLRSLEEAGTGVSVELHTLDVDVAVFRVSWAPEFEQDISTGAAESVSGCC